MGLESVRSQGMVSPRREPVRRNFEFGLRPGGDQRCDAGRVEDLRNASPKTD